MADVILPHDGVVLTREELAFVVRLVGAAELPGVGEDPLGELSLEQAAFAIVFAERSLRARGLASIDQHDQLDLDPRLVSLVVTCAYAEQALWLAQSISGGEPFRVYGYLRGDQSVIHTKPAPVLHRLRALPDRSALIDALLDHAGCAALPPTPGERMTVPTSVVAAIAGREQEANAALLRDHGAGVASSESFARVLASPHALSSFLHLVPNESSVFRWRDLSVLHNGDAAWQMIPREDDNAFTLIEPISTERLATLLAAWVSSPAPTV